jgi:hypothetical protein
MSPTGRDPVDGLVGRMVGALAVALVVVLVAVGCGGPDDETATPTTSVSAAPASVDDLPEVPVGTAEVGPGHEVRLRGSRLVVDGAAVDLAPMRVDELAVVVGGVYFRNGSELWFTDLQRARATGYDDVTSLIASSDGRRFAFVDLEHGPPDDHGTPLATSVAYDATTGKALVASYAGMGDIASDDLADLYHDREPRLLGFEDDTLLVRGASGGDFRVPLDGGTAEEVPSPTG